ncbi:hypothetical protein GLP30_02535 [Photobacterium phosphoreum]|uniref:N-acetylmuramoyl-L-alanine amidase n=1 Tax=Photobacterium phosphoreum TaxID=659 RepID=A0AAW4ZJU1_PHOPO|nr:hypothetical protein [Photobacterium phosphoreum]MCD9489318.1 hypothetical protein [Photobacterium phosphoreum]MCF2188972.1 hypothetical protein [Photobacterium phosphoreum]MCF2300615.1 hypothetical protein [Photobacterium phosphoreum]
MASGEWRVASGEWRVASGEWRVASGEWRVARFSRPQYYCQGLVTYSAIPRNSSLLLPLSPNNPKYN